MSQAVVQLKTSIETAFLVMWELSIYSLSYLFLIFTHLNFCLATATHNFKWVKIIQISIILDQNISFPITR